MFYCFDGFKDFRWVVNVVPWLKFYCRHIYDEDPTLPCATLIDEVAHIMRGACEGGHIGVQSRIYVGAKASEFGQNWA